MAVKKILLILKKLLLALLYVALFLYTITFPTPVSWVVLYFSTVILLISFFSTFILWGTAQFEVVQNQNHHLNGRLQLKTKGFLPIVVPYLSISIHINGQPYSTTVSSLFHHTFTAHFPDIILTRGHHKKIFIRTSGQDFLGLFSHHSKKELPVDLKIYPNLLSSDTLYATLKQIDSTLDLNQFPGQNSVNFRQLREYQIQDTLKDIDWKSSFKKQSLMVKEYDKDTDMALQIYFLGYQSAQFEELLSLTYSLYVELSHYQTVRLFLISEENERFVLHQDVKAFLTIQPTQNKVQLKKFWDKQVPSLGKKIVIAPTEIVQSLQVSHVKSISFLSEENLVHLKIGGN